MKTAFFASWRCLCTDVEPTKDAIARYCPNHNRELLGPVQTVEIDETTTFGVEATGSAL